MVEDIIELAIGVELVVDVTSICMSQYMVLSLQ